MSHELDKTVKQAVVPYCAEREYWPLPDGTHTHNPKVAARIAAKMAAIIEANGGLE